MNFLNSPKYIAFKYLHFRGSNVERAKHEKRYNKKIIQAAEMRGDFTIKSAVSHECVDKVILLRDGRVRRGKNSVIGMRENLRKAIKKFQKP